MLDDGRPARYHVDDGDRRAGKRRQLEQTLRQVDTALRAMGAGDPGPLAPLIPMTIRVTHVYRYAHGQWRIRHRHADFPPADQRPEGAGR